MTILIFVFISLLLSALTHCVQFLQVTVKYVNLLLSYVSHAIESSIDQGFPTFF